MNPEASSSSCCQSHADPSGAAPSAVIDALTHDPRTDEVVLIMVEPQPWDGSEARLFHLQERLNAYLSFALDGEMAHAYPALVEKPLRLRIDCASMPDQTALGFMQMVHDQVSLQGIQFEVRVREGSAGCGAGCGCAAQA